MILKSIKKINSSILCIMLIVAMACVIVGCSTNNKGGENQESAKVNVTEEKSDNVLGEGNTKFTFTVVDKDSNEESFEIHTDKKTVGEALLELDLITGDEGEYGLFVKSVNGITADYDIDKTYWAFYINGKYATSGVDKTNIEEGATYSFKVEK